MSLAGLGQWLRTRRVALIVDPVVVFAMALVAITIALALVGDDPLARQAVV